MGLLSFLKKGRGFGDLKDIRKSHYINAEIIRVLKELDAVDRDAEAAKRGNNYGRYFACIAKQVSLMEQVDHFVHVRLVRAEYGYKEILTILQKAEEDYRNQAGRLQQEIKLLSKNRDQVDSAKITASINKTSHDLKHFKQHITEMRGAIDRLRKHLREACKIKIRKTRHIYRFA